MTRCIITIKMPDGYHSVMVFADGYPDGTRSRELAESIVCNKESAIFCFQMAWNVATVKTLSQSAERFAVTQSQGPATLIITIF